MKEFRKVLFNGYQRDEVDEYVSGLLREMEELNRKLQEMETLKDSKMQLELELENLKAKLKKSEEIQEKLRKYESDYSGFMSLMVNMKEEAKRLVTDAQSDAEHILSAAQEKAEQITANAGEDANRITEQAKNEANQYKKEAEDSIFKQRQEDVMRFEAARIKIERYVDSINRTQQKLFDFYDEFGRVIKQLPISISDMLGEDAFKRLEDNSESDEGNEDL